MIGQSDNQLGPYRLTERLGDGGMGEVWEAIHRDRPGVPVALKVIRGGAGSEAVDQAMREGRIGLGLCHPNIARTFDVGFSSGRAYIVLELLRGATLAELCPLPGEPLPFQAAAAVALQALAGLQHAHAALGEDGRPLHLVHDDVKGSNLFLTADGTIKVLDFGIASVLVEPRPARAGAGRAGTLEYMAPERVVGNPGDARSDLYALALVVAELLSGKPVLQALDDAGARDAILRGGMAPLPALPAELPADFRRWLHIALRADPRERFGTAADMAAALRACAPDPWTPDALAAWYAARPRASPRGASAGTRRLDREAPAAVVVLSSATAAAESSRAGVDPGEIFSRERTLQTPMPPHTAEARRTAPRAAGPGALSAPERSESASHELTTARVPLQGRRRGWRPWCGALLGLLLLAALTGATWATQRESSQDGASSAARGEKASPRRPGAARRSQGWISVTTGSLRTRIRVDGRDVGEAPVVRYALAPGVYVVEAVRSDGRRLAQRVRVAPGRGERLSFE